MQGSGRLFPNPEEKLDKRTRAVLQDLFSRLPKYDQRLLYLQSRDESLTERLKQVVCTQCESN